MQQMGTTTITPTRKTKNAKTFKNFADISQSRVVVAMSRQNVKIPKSFGVFETT